MGRPFFTYNKIPDIEACSSEQKAACENPSDLGACCFTKIGVCDDGTYIDGDPPAFSRNACDYGGGVFYMDKLCSDPEVDCPPVEPYAFACCMPEGGCQTLTYEQCVEAGGDFKIGTSCSEATCTPMPDPSPS